MFINHNKPFLIKQTHLADWHGHDRRNYGIGAVWSDQEDTDLTRQALN